MQLGVKLKCLIKVGGEIGDLIRWSAANGFAAVDMLEPNQQVLRMARDFDLQIGTFDTIPPGKVLTPNAAHRRESMAKLKDQLHQAADLGLATWFFCLLPEDFTLSRKENFIIFKDIFPEVIAHCESLHIKLAMEQWPGPAPHYPALGYTPEMLRAMFAAIPSPNFGICYDPSHLVRLGIDPIRFLHEFKNRIHYAHAKDCRIDREAIYQHGTLPPVLHPSPLHSEGWWRYTISGNGEIQWIDLLASLRQAGYNGILSIELEDADYLADVESAKRGVMATKTHLQSLL